MKKTLFILLGCLVFAAIGQAQNERKSLTKAERKQARWDTEQVFRKTAFGINLQNQQNSVVSPLLYSGGGLSLLTERLRVMPTNIIGTNTRLQFNIISAAGENKASTYSVVTQFGAEYLKPVLGQSLYVGGNVQASLNARIGTHLGNNFLQYEAMPTLGISALYQRKFEMMGRSFGFEATVKLPILGAIAATPRYTYSTDVPLGFDFVTIGKMFNPQTAFYLNLPTGKRFPNKTRRIGYEWNLTRLNRGNGQHLTLATHSILFVASINKLK